MHDSTPNPRRPGLSRPAATAVVFAYFTAIGLLLFGYHYLDDVAREVKGTMLVRLIEEMTGAYAAVIIVPFFLVFARRWRPETYGWPGTIARHAAFAVTFSAVHTTLNYLLRLACFQIAGLGTYDYGIMWVRYLMELPNDLIYYAMFAGIVYLFDHYRASRDRELLTAQLEANLTLARLDALRLQLNPHFLFNTLNTISAAVYDDPRAADEMISKLSDLLRATLADGAPQEVALDDELRTLDLYLSIMRERFGDRLVVDVDAPPEVRRAAVPALVLQPLVENAIRHGADLVTGEARVTVRARRAGDRLELGVEDEGSGLEGDWRDSAGIGLANTATRLAALYGDAHVFALENREGVGAVVRLSIPFRAVPSAAPVEGAEIAAASPHRR